MYPANFARWLKLGGILAISLSLLVMMLFGVVSRAATITTGSAGTYATIQAAVDAASSGDTILIQAETFSESVVISKSVTLLGGYDAAFTNRVPRTTVISPAGRALYIGGAGVTGINVTIDGFEIAHANTAGVSDGAGIYVDVEDDSTIVINNNYIHHNTSADDGGGIYADIDNRSNLQITNNDVMSNTTAPGSLHYYGGIYANVYLSGTLTITGNNISYNASGDNYGGIYARVEDFGQFQIEDNVVMSNTAVTFASDDDGGLYFYASNNSHGTFDRNQVIGNQADDNYPGARVEIEYNSSATFYDNEFRDNASNNGRYGGLYLSAYANSHVNGDMLILADNKINGATDDYGGGYIYAEYNSTIDLPNTRITGNRAGDDYGGAYFEAYDHSTITATNLYVYNNRAGGDYGGVYLDADDGNDTIIATNAQVISNTAVTGRGGGGSAYAEDGSLLDLSGSRFISNTAGADGGGLYVSYINNGSRMLLAHTQFLTNTAGGNGGGFYSDDGPSYGSYLNMSHSRFISNTAGADGGGFYLNDLYNNDPAQVAVQADHLTFRRNTAGSDGGGFYFMGSAAQQSPGKLIFDDGVYKNNTAQTGDGGALDLQYCYYGCSLSMSRNHFEGNTAAAKGGAVYFYQAQYASEVHIDDNTFVNNTASGGDGGGFYNNYFIRGGGSGSFNRNTLAGNTAGGDGGGFYSDSFGYDGADVSFSDNAVASNTANGRGGGAYIDSPAYEGVTLNFNRNVITGNTSTRDGGGLYFSDVAYGARVQFRDNIISHNTISSTFGYDGGGVYMYTIDEGSIMWMTGNKINDNIAAGGGGGFYIDDYIDYGSRLFFEDNELQRNWAGYDGGGCYFDDYWEDGAIIYFNRNRINDNVALGDAGGCYFYDIDYANIDMMNNQFNRNTAGDDYGALYFDGIYDGSIMRFYNNQVNGNRAGIVETAFVAGSVVATPTQTLGGDYGGIYMEDIDNGGEVDFRHNQIISNTAYVTYTAGITPVNGDFGGLYVDMGGHGGLFTMEDNVVQQNSAQKDFGGAYIDLNNGSRLVMARNLITANTAITTGGGLVIEGRGDSQYFMDSNAIVNNSAADIGGALFKNTDTVAPYQKLWGNSINNLIANNSGGGVVVQDADFYGYNNTIANNGAYGILMTGTVTSTLYLSNTIVWGHNDSLLRTDVPTYTSRFSRNIGYSDIEGALIPGAGNINSNPLFVGGGDYSLQSASPARNTGLNSAAPAFDIDGVPRPVPVGGTVDMGAYEFHQPGATLASNQTATALPGVSKVYTLTLTNDGDAAATFDLDVYASSLRSVNNPWRFNQRVLISGWNVTVSPQVVTLNPGASAAINVTVDVPANATGGAVNNATVRATSQSDPEIIGAVTIDTTAANVADVSITADQKANLVPGLVMQYAHTVYNTNGNFTDTIALSAVSSQGWSATVSPAAVNLAPGGSAVVTVSLTVPGNAAAGTVDVTTVTAASSATEGATTDNAIDTGTVLQFAKATLATNESGVASSGSSVTYNHTIANTGNGGDTFDFSTVSSQGWGVTVSPLSVSLAAGASATVQVTVNVPAGASQTDVTTVTAASQINNTVQASVQDTTQVQMANVSLAANQTANLTPNTVKLYTHTLSNNGNFTDSISISVVSSQGWSATASSDSVTLSPGGSAVVTVSLTVPANAVVGTIDTTTVTATSSASAGTTSASVTDTGTVIAATSKIFLPLIIK